MLQIARWFCCLLTRFCCRSLFVGSGPTPPKLTDWGYSIWGYYVFAMIIPLAYLMNLYTILVLVLSRYHGQRMLKMDQRDLDCLLTCTVEREAERVIAMSKVQSQKRYLQYMASTATSRHLAVLSFISSLPLLLLSLAAKQYDTLPEVVAIPTSIVLFVGTTGILLMVVIFVVNEGKEFLETRKLNRSAANKILIPSKREEEAAWPARAASTASSMRAQALPAPVLGPSA